MSLFRIHFVIYFLLFICCENKKNPDINHLTQNNSIEYAKGFELYHYDTFSILKVTKPWPNATNENAYILKKKTTILHDSLTNYPVINIPIKSLIATSTTHIPSLEMLGVENTLIGFPNTDYISSKKTRKRINNGLVKDIGSNEALNTELVIDLEADLFVGFGIDGTNPTLDLLKKMGQNVIFNGDWVEQSPLGKAEWIKFFGALYDQNNKATTLFNTIKKNYNITLDLIQTNSIKPTILSGSIYQDKWNVPQGNSWAGLFFKDAQGDYLWSNTTGTGSLSLSFETVFVKAKEADFWIGSGQFTSLQEMKDSNPHYQELNAFKNKKIYSNSIKKGEKGGLIYYELAPNHPDLVLKDLIKILHPEWIPNHELFFYEQLK